MGGTSPEKPRAASRRRVSSMMRPPGPGCASTPPAETFRMLADPTRHHLLWLLTQGEADVSALAEVDRRVPARLSGQHLAKLQFARLVDTRKDGRRVFYRLQETRHLGRLVQEGLNHADHPG